MESAYCHRARFLDCEMGKADLHNANLSGAVCQRRDAVLTLFERRLTLCNAD